MAGKSSISNSQHYGQTCSQHHNYKKPRWTRAYREEVNTLHHGLQNPSAVVVETSTNLPADWLFTADCKIQMPTDLTVGPRRETFWCWHLHAASSQVQIVPTALRSWTEHTYLHCSALPLQNLEAWNSVKVFCVCKSLLSQNKGFPFTKVHLMGSIDCL